MGLRDAFRHKKSHSVSRTALLYLGRVWNWKVTFGWRCVFLRDNPQFSVRL